MTQTHAILFEQFAKLTQPFSGITVSELEQKIDQYSVCPDDGSALSEVLTLVGQNVLKHSVAVHHPACIAHLHCPPMIPALAAEVIINASNQSMDSWDQSPAATIIEKKLVAWLCDLIGYNQSVADGIFTSGGTQSNFMGLLLARERYCKEKWGWDVQKQGLPPEANKLRILCSSKAHFTVKQSAALLGLGEEAVVLIETDKDMQLSLSDLDKKISEITKQGLFPFALVATAGSTDFGAIDPILGCATRAIKHDMWFHVDAAYGGAVMLSEHYKHLLDHIQLADSITVDFHKLFYQPISCGAFLIKNQDHFQLIKSNTAYLNPEENELEGIPDLVTKSIQTTRRFDALKLWVSLQAIGRTAFAELIEYTLSLAQKTAQLISNEPLLELVNKNPTLNAIVFRYIGSSVPTSSVELNHLQTLIRKNLWESGKVVLAQTKVDSSTYLKFTMLNPNMTMKDVHMILDQIKKMGNDIESQKRKDDYHV
ncbi:pyridoxal phosphate-dependent decarboxylase family protein [Shimazuella kribbensis]|uniref:pyridoxal phosphate-dependent decarboxylase family protein n=1 Tax=Shimazuella kribbensis TaxID=139808 RepID=UPI000410F5F8|nr:aspartate aminotransferase family protein [Shimazuella kribbensis]